MSEAEYRVEHDDFAALIEPTASLRHLAGGCAWAEGPVYLPHEHAVWWSDVLEDRRLRHDLATGETTVLHRPSNFSNGHTLDHDGSVIACEHGSRSVVRFAVDGTRTTVADRWRGARLNSPNDVVVAADGAVWFTDPTYGIDSDEEGHAAPSEIGSSNVYRVDRSTGAVEAIVTSMVQPNGLAFTRDGRALYVVDSGFSHGAHLPRHIRRFRLIRDAAGNIGVPDEGTVVAACDVGIFDGLRVDADDRIWVGSGDGVRCYSPTGALLGTVVLPERCANLVFGGPDRRTLFMTATSSLYALDVRAAG